MRTPLRAGLALWLSLFLVTPSAFSQKAPPEKPRGDVGPVVKNVDVSVTNLDVVVTDSKGNRIRGLTKDDFEVVEDGLKQNLTNFFAVEGGQVTMFGDEVITPPPAPTAAAAPVPVPTAVPDPAVAPLPIPKTRIVIFVDNLSLSPFNRNRVLRSVEAWARESIKGNVEAMVVTWDRSLKVRKKFTNDGRDISDVLKQVEEVSALGVQKAAERRDVLKSIDEAESEATAVQRARSHVLSLQNDLQFTINALKTTINQLAGLDGRKILLHVSDGLPQSPGAELWTYIQDRFRSQGVGTYQFEFDATSQYLGIIKEANAAGVTIYAVDAMGLADDSNVSAEHATTKARINTFIERQNLQSMLTLMSEETGGAAFLNRNDISIPLKEIERDYTSYYSLGYRSLRSGGDRPHSVEVKVKKKGLRVRARRTYQEKSFDTRIAEAVVSGLFFQRDDNPLGIALETGQPVPYRENYHVPVQIRVPYSRITLLPDGEKYKGRLLFYFVVVDANDKQSDLVQMPLAVQIDAKKFNLVSRTDFIYETKLEMLPGPHRLSLAVRDEITNSVSYIQQSIFVSVLPSAKPGTSGR
ncbi:MAG: VWA domain-containing protein [Thermoanaerobaculia bacterium]|nr:hypothetical protein [Thermoanaerobaculia bacterium]MCK6681730.1 VWA domain-containing protein [Thermoanaerobaculia bacterium]